VKKLWKLPRRRETLFVGNDGQDARISLPELEEALASVEPAARLVLPRLLRRVVRLHTSLPGFGFRVPHSKTYVIPGKELLEFADRNEIGFGPTEVLPEEVILLERPSGEVLDEWPRGEILLYYWALLFHARVHEAFGGLVRPGQDVPLAGSACRRQPFGAGEIEKRKAALGSLEFDEIRNVLRQERFLLPPYSDAAVYVEFAAVYLGLRYFQPYQTASFFPALLSLEKADEVIAQDIDACALLEATRLPGTPDPEELREAARQAAEAFDADPQRAIASMCGGAPSPGRDADWARGRHRSEKKYLAWSQTAARKAARGNLAGAAMARARAEFWAPRERAAEAATALREEVHGLVARLQTALDIEGEEPRPWREALLALAHQTPRGLWTVEARLLYDLQKVCVDRSRMTSTVDVMHWILSFGRRAIRRELPNQRDVLVSRHLRSAQRRLPRVRISDRQRRQLAKVVDQATAEAETRLRDTFRPKIAATLDATGLLPQNLPERISRAKLVEELLDRIVERGFLTLGEVRDAISRNQLKEPDCSGPRGFLRGEVALRMNSRLTETLDGVYEPADFYLRWILRFSHLMFGTAVGRLLTLHFVIPFGGAYVALKGSDHIIELVSGEKRAYLAPSNRDFGRLLSGGLPLRFVPTILLGIFLEMLIHIPSFRGMVWQGLKALGSAVTFLLIDVPRWFFALPWVHWVVHSPAVRLGFNFVVKPLVPTLLFAEFVPLRAKPWQEMLGLTSMFFALNLIVNSRAWRTVEEMFFDAVAEGWQRFGVRPIVGLFWFIVDMFRRLVQLIERLLYTVDEWLRFRSGQSRVMLLAKGTLGVGWFFVAYVIRFCVNLLIEPQLNPLKHVPWVTVSHKIMAPIWYAMDLPNHLAQWMSPFLADVLTFVIVFGTPGIFGFLIWELKENWRLFAANRPKNVQPVLVGAHGETMARLLRPGFHSGTIPKRFAKLRRAERKARRGGDPGVVRKHREALHHIEIDLRRYVEREFAVWFVADRGWSSPPPQVEEIHLATNEASVEVALPGAVEDPLCLAFQLVDGRTHLVLSEKVPAAMVSDSTRIILRAAIINLLKTGGIEVFYVSSDDSRRPAAAEPQEISRVEMPWTDWVATWETGDGPREPAPWDRLPVI
jgi:hypothetical protein